MSSKMVKEEAVGLVGGLFKIPKTWIMKRKELKNY
jgi:hypothetical protein